MLKLNWIMRIYKCDRLSQSSSIVPNKMRLRAEAHNGGHWPSTVGFYTFVNYSTIRAELIDTKFIVTSYYNYYNIIYIYITSINLIIHWAEQDKSDLADIILAPPYIYDRYLITHTSEASTAIDTMNVSSVSAIYLWSSLIPVKGTIQQYLVQKQRRRNPRQLPPLKPSFLHTCPQLVSLTHGPLNPWLFDWHSLASAFLTVTSVFISIFMKLINHITSHRKKEDHL